MADLPAIADRLARYPRLAGYYLLRFRDITPLRNAGLDEEAICDIVIPELDDKTWPPPEDRPQDQSWADYRADRDFARKEMIAALVGGREIGHTSDTIPRDIATQIVDEFESLFGEPRQYYSGLGLGDHQYVYSTGCAIVGPTSAGCLIVVESD